MRYGPTRLDQAKDQTEEHQSGLATPRVKPHALWTSHRLLTLYKGSRREKLEPTFIRLLEDQSLDYIKR
ncbi:hypothetical protein LINGRAHAP2_LOCUS31666, partial [Linum grandiflorum]